jgi:hypothetical protein
MAITVLEAERYVHHALMGVVHPDISLRDIVNRAGSLFVGLHPWQWLRRRSAQLDLVQGQTYLTLPSDFQTLTAIEWTNGLVNDFQPASLRSILSLRHQSRVPQNPTYYDFSWLAPANGQMTQVLELSIVPGQSETGAVSIFYDATWAPKYEDSDHLVIAPVPGMEVLYLEVLRAVARGWEEDDDASMTARIAEIKAGPIFMAAARADGRTMPPMTLEGGGALQDLAYDNFFDTGQLVSDP